MTRCISVVIPALNEVKKLPDNVAQLARCEAVQEIIVVDGGSTDGTFEAMLKLAEQASPVRLALYRSEPGRAQQMNFGAGQASGEWLLFHHADSFLSTAAIQAIVELGDEQMWGGFEHSFSPNNWKLKLVSWLHNFRWRQTGVVYGDQSMFVRRSLFGALGGFKEHTIEDLEFSDRALEQAASVLLPFRVQTDSRKFLQMGEFRALWKVCVILWRYERNRQVGEREFFQPYR